MTQEQAEEAEYLRLRAKRHLLGNITLIGELFKLQMLSERIMHAWYARPTARGLVPLCAPRMLIGACARLHLCGTRAACTSS